MAQSRWNLARAAVAAAALALAPALVQDELVHHSPRAPHEGDLRVHDLQEELGLRGREDLDAQGRRAGWGRSASPAGTGWAW